jgi:predicted RNA polymerase sigma factor
MAKDFKQTNWQSIYDQYELLYKLKKNPIIKLNMAIISSQLQGIPKAIHALEELISDKELETYYFLYATLGIFNLKMKDHQKARRYLIKAKSLTSSEQEQQFLNKRILECQI